MSVPADGGHSNHAEPIPVGPNMIPLPPDSPPTFTDNPLEVGVSCAGVAYHRVARCSQPGKGARGIVGSFLGAGRGLGPAQSEPRTFWSCETGWMTRELRLSCRRPAIRLRRRASAAPSGRLMCRRYATQIIEMFNATATGNANSVGRPARSGQSNRWRWRGSSFAQLQLECSAGWSSRSLRPRSRPVAEL